MDVLCEVCAKVISIKCDGCGKETTGPEDKCEGCKKELKRDYVKCDTCLSVFCCEDCRKKENAEHCRPHDAKLVTQTLHTFGMSKDSKLPQYRGRSIIGLPGPIKGKIPVAMRPVDGDSGRKVIEEWKKHKITLGQIAHAHYLVDISDLPRAFFIQLTEEQRNEFGAMLEAQVKEMMSNKRR